MVAFPCKICAPVTGITLSTRVGRLSETHSDTCIPLMQVHDGKEGDGTVRRKSPLRSIVEHCSLKTVARRSRWRRSCWGRRKVCGKVSCETTMNQKAEKEGNSLCSTLQVRSQGVPREYPDEWLELRWIRPGQTSLIPLLAKGGGGKPFVQGWTHTHTPFPRNTQPTTKRDPSNTRNM